MSWDSEIKLTLTIVVILLMFVAGILLVRVQDIKANIEMLEDELSRLENIVYGAG